MKTIRINQILFGAAVLGLLLMAAVFFNGIVSFSATSESDLDYFKGKWTVTLKNNPKESFNWTVKEDSNYGWMVGIVEKNGAQVSTDFWRQNGKRIERFAFPAGGAFVKIEGGGWESNRLVLSGTLSKKTGETKIRETITKISDRQFHALWESETPEGIWVTFSDEICTR